MKQEILNTLNEVWANKQAKLVEVEYNAIHSDRWEVDFLGWAKTLKAEIESLKAQIIFVENL